MSLPTISVSQLNIFVKSLLESEQRLKDIYISGEISNFTNHYSSGHFYLSLKDDKASIKAVMFRYAAQKVPFKPENGMKVICKGRVSLYERDGSYQFYIDDMQPDGVGALQLAFEQLKTKLHQAGLFDPQCKRPIPKYPSNIAVITSATGAALQDIINVISRRYPIANLILIPALVQGQQAPKSLTEALRKVNELNCADVIIIGRGGGSIEDLWAFNDEQLAYAIFESNIPVISAVGHEIDYTICDFVADLRAPTPSAAAEIVVPDVSDISESLLSLKLELQSRCNIMLRNCEEALLKVSNRRCLTSPEAYLDSISERVDRLQSNILSLGNKFVEECSLKLAISVARIDAMSPLKTISRGYSVSRVNNQVIKSVKDVNIGDSIAVSVKDGQINCEVNSICTEKD